MLLEFVLSTATILVSYTLYRRYSIRNLVPYPVIGAIYAIDRPLFGLMFLGCFSISLILGELMFRKFLIYGMRVFHIQLLASLLTMFPYSLISSDTISLALSLLSGQMAYDAHSSRDQVTSAILFIATFLTLYLAQWLVRRFS
ncbi:MAG: hypothetical protein QXH90_00080 [Candidatus Korarchaeum sp.]